MGKISYLLVGKTSDVLVSKISPLLVGKACVHSWHDILANSKLTKDVGQVEMELCWQRARGGKSHPCCHLVSHSQTKTCKPRPSSHTGKE